MHYIKYINYQQFPIYILKKNSIPYFIMINTSYKIEKPYTFCTYESKK